MRLFGISANLMSLGAIDFGMIVDGAVVMMENSVHRLDERAVQKHRWSQFSEQPMKSRGR